ncbi:MAG: hypothetical protein QNJ41_12570 [Xenococcaceae cyanobacterium MO_188.B32]|nr:hypothetical protein [Xenococcaceae cyanobacterium MO_188.B32]
MQALVYPHVVAGWRISSIVVGQEAKGHKKEAVARTASKTSKVNEVNKDRNKC